MLPDNSTALEARKVEIQQTRVHATDTTTQVLNELARVPHADARLIIDGLQTIEHFRNLAIDLARDVLDADSPIELDDEQRVFVERVVEVLDHDKARRRYVTSDINWRLIIIEASTSTAAAYKALEQYADIHHPSHHSTYTTALPSEQRQLRAIYDGFTNRLRQKPPRLIKSGEPRTTDIIEQLASMTDTWIKQIMPFAHEMSLFFERSVDTPDSQQSPPTPSPTTAHHDTSVPSSPAIAGQSSPRKRSRTVYIEEEPASPHRAHDAPHEQLINDDDSQLVGTQPPLRKAPAMVMSRIQIAARANAAKLGSVSQVKSTASPRQAPVPLTAEPLAAVVPTQRPEDSVAPPQKLRAANKQGHAAPGQEREAAMTQHGSGEGSNGSDSAPNGSNGSTSSSVSQPPPAQTRQSEVPTSSSRAYASALDEPVLTSQTLMLVPDTQSTTSSKSTNDERRTDPGSSQALQASALGATSEQTAAKENPSGSGSQQTDSLEYIDDPVAHKKHFEEQQKAAEAAKAQRMNGADVATNGDAMMLNIEREEEEDDRGDEDDDMPMAAYLNEEDSVSSPRSARSFSQLADEATPGAEDADVIGDILARSRRSASPFFSDND